MNLQILPVEGIPELRPGDDLTAQIAAAAPWIETGDVVVVTSKAVSKVEGRLWPAAAGERESVRQAAIDAETVRVVASRGPTRIVENQQGFVVAAAGVDASNVRTDEIALLPIDSDVSARRLRDGLAQTLAVDVAVVITDTAGRPWRTGVTDYAVGAAGIRALHSLRGIVDPLGNELAVTEVAVADEIAAATDLVKGKLGGIPAAILRGLEFERDDAGIRPLVRPSDQDLFRLGTAEAIEQGRRDALAPRPVITEFADKPVDPEAVSRALRAAAAVGDDPGWRLVLLESAQSRLPLERTAPVLVAPCLLDTALSLGAAPSPELSLGAALERLRISLAGDGLHTLWLPADRIDLPDLQPVGLLGIGRPLDLPPARAEADPAPWLLRR